jgi:cellulose synthase operon protein C
MRVLCMTLACSAVAACGLWLSDDQKVARGREHFAEGRYRSAMSEAKGVLESAPSHGPARLLLAEVMFWLGDTEDADRELARAEAAGVSPADASELHYALLLANKRYDAALAALEQERTMPEPKRLVLQSRARAGRGELAEARDLGAKAVEAAPDDPGALLQLASLEAERGELQRALDLAARVKEPEVMRARALILRGSIASLRGQTDAARQALSEALAAGSKQLRVPERLTLLVSLTEQHLSARDAAAASRTIDQLAAWTPQSLAVHFLRARVAMLKNDPVQAVAECQRALAIDPRHVPSQLLLAAAHLSHGSLEQAENALDRLLAADPGNVAATKLMAQIYLGRNQPGKARQVLGTLAGNSADAQVDWLLGSALLQSGDISGLANLERALAHAPNDATLNLQLAAAYISAGQPEKAVALLKAVPADSPLATRAQALTVIASVAGKGPEQARREIERLVAADGRNVNLLVAAGAQLLAIGDLQQAKAVLDRAVQLDPKAVAPRWSLAQLAARTQDFDAAQSRLQEILQMDRRFSPAYLGLAELALQRGDRAQARKRLEEAVGADPTAVDARLRLAQLAFVEGDGARGKAMVEQAVTAAGDRKRVLISAGEVLARAGLVEEALASFKRAALAGIPEGTLKAARLYAEAGRLDDARQLLEAGLVERPDWTEAEQLLIDVDARNGRVDQALARLRSRAGSAEPATLREREGDTYALGKRYADAIAAYEDAQRIRPSGALALKLFRARSVSVAPSPERSLLAWLQRSPEDSQVRAMLAAYYQSQGRSNEALAEYERMLAADRIDPLSLNNLAWMLQEKGDPRATAVARRAFEGARHVAEIADTYGWILVQTGKVADGTAVLERALAGAPNNADIQYHVAVAYAKSGQATRSAALLRQTLRDHQTFASRADAEQLVRTLPEVR